MSLEIEFRKGTINHLDKVIKDTSISKKIEESIYKFTNDYTEQHGTPFLFESIYQNKLNEILKNLDETSDNKTLLENIKNEAINPDQLAYLKPEELDPDKYEPIIKRKELEETFKPIMDKLMPSGMPSEMPSTTENTNSGPNIEEVD
mgnify:CR=1 FL=1